LIAVPEQHQAGQLLSHDASQLIVCCGTADDKSYLRLLELQKAGGKRLSIAQLDLRTFFN
jgi:methionyl-tRNA formyltransferase